MTENNKVYIVLTQTYSSIARIIKLITHDTYSHASLSLDLDCKKMYSFGRKYLYFPFYGVFLHEDLNRGLLAKKNAIMSIYEVNVSEDQYNRIKSKINSIKKTNKGYNIIGLLVAKFKIKLQRNKYYCSEFVYEVLSSDGINIFDKKNVKFKPEELINDNFKKIYEGSIRDYVSNL